MYLFLEMQDAKSSLKSSKELLKNSWEENTNMKSNCEKLEAKVYKFWDISYGLEDKLRKAEDIIKLQKEELLKKQLSKKTKQ